MPPNKSTKIGAFFGHKRTFSCSSSPHAREIRRISRAVGPSGRCASILLSFQTYLKRPGRLPDRYVKGEYIVAFITSLFSDAVFFTCQCDRRVRILRFRRSRQTRESVHGPCSVVVARRFRCDAACGEALRRRRPPATPSWRARGRLSPSASASQRRCRSPRRPAPC